MNPTTIAEVVEVRPRELGNLWSPFESLDRGVSVVLRAEAQSLTARTPVPAGPGPWLGVTSSGSMGVPKLVWRSWHELRTQAKSRPGLQNWVWASPSGPSTFAGVQVALQAWVSGGRALSLTSDLQATWQTLLREQPEALSATPPFLDLLLQSEPASDRRSPICELRNPNFELRTSNSELRTQAADSPPWSPRQVTIGGEPLRSGIGARLVARWPNSHFTVIYAAAEFGVVAKANRVDGWYELQSLAKRWPEWRVVAEVGSRRSEVGKRRTVDLGCRSGSWSYFETGNGYRPVIAWKSMAICCA